MLVWDLNTYFLLAKEVTTLLTPSSLGESLQKPLILDEYLALLCLYIFLKLYFKIIVELDL